MDKSSFYGVKNRASTNLKKVKLHLYILLPEKDLHIKQVYLYGEIKLLQQRFYVLVKTWAADLYLIYKLEPKARVCISDKDRMRMC
jgi:hypothetical protein